MVPFLNIQPVLVFQMHASLGACWWIGRDPVCCCRCHFSQFTFHSHAVIVRILTNSNPSEHFLQRDTEFSSTDGIDDWVAYCTEEENARCGEDCLGWNIDSRDKIAAKAHNPGWEKAHQKRRDDDGDIDGCLPISYSPGHFLLLRAFSINAATHLHFNGVYLPFCRLVYWHV